MDKTEPLCGDVTCREYACTGEARDAYFQRQWDDAGRYVYGLLGLEYTPNKPGF